MLIIAGVFHDVYVNVNRGLGYHRFFQMIVHVMTIERDFERVLTSRSFFGFGGECTQRFDIENPDRSIAGLQHLRFFQAPQGAVDKLA